MPIYTVSCCILEKILFLHCSMSALLTQMPVTMEMFCLHGGLMYFLGERADFFIKAVVHYSHYEYTC